MNQGHDMKLVSQKEVLVKMLVVATDQKLFHFVPCIFAIKTRNPIPLLSCSPYSNGLPSIFYLNDKQNSITKKLKGKND